MCEMVSILAISLIGFIETKKFAPFLPLSIFRRFPSWNVKWLSSLVGISTLFSAIAKTKKIHSSIHLEFLICVFRVIFLFWSKLSFLLEFFSDTCFSKNSMGTDISSNLFIFSTGKGHRGEKGRDNKELSNNNDENVSVKETIILRMIKFKENYKRALCKYMRKSISSLFYAFYVWYLRSRVIKNIKIR